VSKSALQDFRPLSDPGDEAAADPGVARALPFLVKPVAVTIASAEKSEPACVADRRREPAAGDEVHWSEQNRVLNSERLRQPILNGHVLLRIVRRTGRSNFRTRGRQTSLGWRSEKGQQWAGPCHGA
jgi:hypothetical protein